MIEKMTENKEISEDGLPIFSWIVSGLVNSVVKAFIPEKPLEIKLTEREKQGTERILQGITTSKGSMLAKEILKNFRNEYDRAELNRMVKYLLREGSITKYQSPNGLGFEPNNTWKNFLNRDMLNPGYK